jgi:hypothetical protein
MRALFFLLLCWSCAAAAEAIRGMPETATQARKPDTASAGASAPAPAAKSPERFAALDLDGDGQVSLAEAAGHEDVVVHFDRADRDRNGRLTVAEYENLGKKEPRRSRTTARTARPKASTSGTRSASNP